MFKIIYSDEAVEQSEQLEKSSRNKILKAIRNFEILGRDAKNTRSLKNGLQEIKADNVRAYFKYYKENITKI